ncbi:flagellar protein FlaG [Metabacillus litoralis]|uniref:flagellar protein FlaG n=1 Tax=Metabacillus litoralis TaxID=152268 RepID=UPI000EF608BC|nr:flagellar protein FlaG [Metabacillus litoralis]
MSVEKVISQSTLYNNPELTKNKSESSSQPSELLIPEYMPSKEDLEKKVSSMNDFVKASNTHLKFELHEELNEYYVTIVDDLSNEIIKEIPSKRLLDIYAAMTDFLGLVVDKKI